MSEIMTPLFVSYSNREVVSQTEKLWKQIKPIGCVLDADFQNEKQLLTLIQQLKNNFPSMLIAMNYEGGENNNFPQDIPTLPSIMNISRNMNWNNIEKSMEIMAQTLAYLQIDINFGLLLNCYSKNFDKEQQNRFFFPDIQLIQEYSKFFVEQHNKYGIYCVAKYFPEMLRKEEVIVNDEKQRLQDITIDDRLSSFHYYTKNFMQGVLVNSFNQLTLFDKKHKAPFSINIIKNLLRKRLLFQGKVFAALDFNTQENQSATIENVIQESFEAGCNFFCDFQKNTPIELYRNFFDSFQKVIQKNPSLKQSNEIDVKELFDTTGELCNKKQQSTKLISTDKMLNICKSFIEKKIYSKIQKLGDFIVLDISQERQTHSPENTKLLSWKKLFTSIPCFYKFFSVKSFSDGQWKVLAQEMKKSHYTLIMVTNRILLKDIQEPIQEIVNLAKKSIAIFELPPISIHNINFDEQWILGSKNHTVLKNLHQQLLEYTK